MQLCRLPFTVLSTARPGRARVDGSEASCYAANGVLNSNCTVTNGTVTVSGSTTLPPAPPAPNFKYLYFLLSAAPGAPTVAQLSTFNFSSGAAAPLVGLYVESSLLATGILPIRASGDFAALLLANPESPRAKLERFVQVQYRAKSNLENAKAALRGNPFVIAVFDAKPDLRPGAPTAPSVAPSNTNAGPVPKTVQAQYHLGALNMPAAWQIAGGWSLIGSADSGLHTESPDLKSFTGVGSVGGTRISGGNFLPVYSADYGDFPINADANVDELEPVPATADTKANALSCDQADGNTDGLMTPSFAGHGTHTSGISVANGVNSGDIEGICRNCGLGMWKVSRTRCIVFQTTAAISPVINVDSLPVAITALADVGAQILNLSFGGEGFVPANSYCNSQPNDPYCLALAYAQSRDVVISAASGNGRARVQFPARDLRAIAVGGTDLLGNLWDEAPTIAPPDYSGCPFGQNGAIFGNGGECGSNFTDTLGERRQELVVPAKNVRATMYPGRNWNDDISCGDSYGGGAANDGIGVCTGTSMSAPIVSGLFGLLRSINPLLRAGNPENSEFGLRDVVAATTNRAQLNLAWNARLCYGVPDAEKAAQRIMGSVRGQTATNRVTPLFALYSPTAKDYAVTATPQTAMSLIQNQAAGYWTEPTGFVSFIAGDSTVPAYPEFPLSFAGHFFRAPRASAYVLTTEFAPRTEPTGTLTPLYLLDRGRNWPSGCATGSPGCNSQNRDFIVLSAIAQVNSAVAAGYAYRGYQGYVYTTQVGGTQPLYLKCKTSDDDCAVFIESQRLSFEAAGYAANFPGASSAILGYAYPSTDSDGDGLVDGMERVMGTDPNQPDSDSDGANDSLEFPVVGVSSSDPCDGAINTCTAPTLTPLFANGFE